MSPAEVVWDDWLLLAVQVLTLLVVIVYVWKTWEMASATRRAAEASERALVEAEKMRLQELAPAILVYFDSSPWLGAQVVIENAGRGAAADVSLSFEPTLQTTQPHETDKFFDSTQSLMPPGYRIAQIFDTWPTLLASDLPKQYAVTVKYRGVQTGQEYQIVHYLDAEAIRYRMHEPRKGTNEVAEELERLRKAAESQWSRAARREYDILFKEPHEAKPPESMAEAVSYLVGFWRLQSTLKAADDILLPLKPITFAVRSMILDAYQLMPGSNLSQTQRAALDDVARAAYSMKADHYDGVEQWWPDMDAAIGTVERSFPGLARRDVAASTD